MLGSPLWRPEGMLRQAILLAFGALAGATLSAAPQPNDEELREQARAWAESITEQCKRQAEQFRLFNDCESIEPRINDVQSNRLGLNRDDLAKMVEDRLRQARLVSSCP